MKQVLLLVIISLTIITGTFSQDAKSYYDQGMQKAYAGKLDEAIGLFDKSIELNQTEYVSWFNRGMAKAMLNNYEDALADYDQTLKLSPLYKVSKQSARNKTAASNCSFSL